MRESDNPLYDGLFQKFLDGLEAYRLEGPLAASLYITIHYLDALMATPHGYPTKEEFHALRPILEKLRVECIHMESQLMVQRPSQKRHRFFPLPKRKKARQQRAFVYSDRQSLSS